MGGRGVLGDLVRALSADFTAMVAARPPAGGPSGRAWLRQLPDHLTWCADAWRLQLAGPVRYGTSAIAVPVTRPEGVGLLKLTWPHIEARHEHLALQAWQGEGAVRLWAAEPTRGALLLELLDAERDLGVVTTEESCAVIGSLLRQLDRPATPQYDTLSDLAHGWAEEIDTAPADVLPRRLASRARALCTELQADENGAARLVHTDLHDANVLTRWPTAGRRSQADAGVGGAWVAIDPKPLAGVPELGVAPLVWNRWDEALRARSLRAELRWRVEVASDAGGLDAQLARGWTLVRCALNVAQMGATDEVAELSAQISICKAMQD